MANPPVGHTDIARFFSLFKETSHLTPRLTAGIYCLLKNGVPAYIGQSRNILGRVSQHRRAKIVDFDEVIFYELDDPSERLRWEAILILFYHPPGNHAIFLGIGRNRIWEIKFKNARNKTT